MLFTSGLDNLKRQNENKLKTVTSEGVTDRKLSLSIAQWTQFLEHDLSKTVARSMSKKNLLPYRLKRLITFEISQPMELQLNAAIRNLFQFNPDIFTNRAILF
jgi:hypothetical protein